MEALISQLKEQIIDHLNLEHTQVIDARLLSRHINGVVGLSRHIRPPWLGDCGRRPTVARRCRRLAAIRDLGTV